METVLCRSRVDVSARNLVMAADARGAPEISSRLRLSGEQLRPFQLVGRDLHSRQRERIHLRGQVLA